ASGTSYSLPWASVTCSSARGEQYSPSLARVAKADAWVSGETSSLPNTNDGSAGLISSPLSAWTYPTLLSTSVISHRSVSSAAAVVAVLMDQYSPKSAVISRFISSIALLTVHPSSSGIVTLPPS